MLFTTLAFGLFFIISFLVYYMLPAKNKWIWLLISSAFFYMFLNPIYILVPILLGLIAYYGGILIEKTLVQKVKKRIFIISTFLIVLILVFFKYINFLTSLLLDFLNLFNSKVFISSGVDNIFVFKILIPLGISFITFQLLGYLIEIYRNNNKAEKNVGHFLTYVLFFPKVLMGPIERPHNFLPQLKKDIKFNYGDVTSGLKLIVWGLIKKAIIADRLSVFVTDVYSNAQNYSGIVLILACIFFTFQLYADFSGYTDMAIGMAKVFGFNLSQNFDRPFIAKSISEFWRRWHMTLSSWFVDYFYNPIAIEKRNWGRIGVIYASMLTFLILGLWHGPNITFLVFGGLHGVMVATEFLTRNGRKKIRKKIPVFFNDVGAMIFTFSFFSFSLIFFRSNSVSDAFYIIKHFFVALKTSQLDQLIIVSKNYWTLIELLISIALLLIMEFYGYSRLSDILNKRPIYFRWLIYIIVVLFVCIFGIYYNKQFIYVQF